MWSDAWEDEEAGAWLGADTLARVVADSASFLHGWRVPQSLAVAHIRAYPPAHAPLAAYRHLLDHVLNATLLRKILWRSKAHNMVVEVRFTGVRVAMPSDQRSTILDMQRNKRAREMTHADWAKERGRTYCIHVMLNATATMVQCGKDVDLEQMTGLSPDQVGELSEAQMEGLRAVSRVRETHVLEGLIVKIPCPFGLEPRDDITQWMPYTEALHAYGTHIINGRQLKQHAIFRPVTNVPLCMRMRSANAKKHLVVVKNYALRDYTYGHAATIVMETPWVPHGLPKQPSVMVTLPYPQKETLSLYLAFGLLKVTDVDAMLFAIWPHGVPPSEVLALPLVRQMLLEQQAAAKARGIVDRDDLFSTLAIDVSQATAQYGADSMSALQQYQRGCAKVTAKMFPQEGGRREVRDTMVAKALQLGSMARATVQAALFLRPLDDKDEPINLRHMYLDHAIGRAIVDSMQKSVVPAVLKSIRVQATNGAAVLGESLLADRHRPTTGSVFALFTNKKKNAAPGDTKAVQPLQASPVDEANATVHLPMPTKAVEAVRSNKTHHTGDVCLHHTSEGDELGLTRARALGARWRAGMGKNMLEVQVSTALRSCEHLVRGRHGIQSMLPPPSAADKAWAATTRSLDFWVHTEFMHRALRHIESSRRPLVLLNHHIAGFLPQGMSVEVAMRVLLEARVRGMIASEVCIYPHALGVCVVSDSGATQRPLLRIDRCRRSVRWNALTLRNRGVLVVTEATGASWW